MPEYNPDIELPPKQCPRCQNTFRRTPEFWPRNKAMPTGLQDYCLLCYRIKQDEWRRAHPDKRKEYDKKYWYRDHENKLLRKRENGKSWRKNNPNKARAITKAYYEAHKALYRLYDQRRNARIAKLPHTLTAAEWEIILRDYNYSCAYCGKAQYEIDGILAQDHIIPLSQGGPYTKDNIAPACKSCNSRKGSRTPEQAGMPIIK